MATTELRRQGADLNRISDRMRRFALEYLVDYDGKNAVIRAGYSKKGASVRACTLLKHKIIKAFLGKFERESQERFEIERNKILRHLAACALRRGGDLFDKKGRLILNHRIINGKPEGLTVHDLPEEIQVAINGCKQKRRIITTEDGTVIEEIETDLRMADKNQAIDMAMKHKGLFAAEKSEHTIQIDWDSLCDQSNVIDVNPIQQRLQLEKRDE